MKRRNKRLKGDIAFARSKVAYKKTLKELNHLKGDSNNKNPKEFYKYISTILKKYVGDKLNQCGGAYTSEDVKQKLSEKNIDNNILNSISCILQKCERTQYGNLKMVHNERLKSMEEARTIVK